MLSGKPGRLSTRISASPARAFEPIALNAIAVRLVDEQETLVLGEGYAVGKVQTVEQHLGVLGRRVVFQQSPVGTPFEHVEQVLIVVELVAGVGEVDGAVAGYGHVVGKAQRHVAVGRHQRGDLAVVADGKQALYGVGHDQVAVGVGGDAHRPPAGVDDFRHGAVGIDSHDAAVFSAGEDASLGVDFDVFRSPHFADRNGLGGSQAIVGRKRSVQGRRRIGIIGHRRDRRRPHQQIAQRQGQQDQSRAADAFPGFCSGRRFGGLAGDLFARGVAHDGAPGLVRSNCARRQAASGGCRGRHDALRPVRVPRPSNDTAGSAQRELEVYHGRASIGNVRLDPCVATVYGGGR